MHNNKSHNVQLNYKQHVIAFRQRFPSPTVVSKRPAIWFGGFKIAEHFFKSKPHFDYILNAENVVYKMHKAII